LSRKFSKITYFCRLKSMRGGPGLSLMAAPSPALQPLPAQRLAGYQTVRGFADNSNSGVAVV
jgi:hypothetical protein